MVLDGPGIATHFTGALCILAGDEAGLRQGGQHSPYSISMCTTWKGAQHAAKRATTVAIMATARFFFLGPGTQCRLTSPWQVCQSDSKAMKSSLSPDPNPHSTDINEVDAQFNVGCSSPFPSLSPSPHIPHITNPLGRVLSRGLMSSVFPASL